jgi:hypothetical protein
MDHRAFKKLEARWYKKLKDAGFDDIEDSTRPGRPLHAWHSFRFYSQNTRSENAELYYQMAAHLLLEFKFENTTHQRIWELHADGWSKRQIEKEISGLVPTYRREQIGNIIAKIAKNIRCKS